MENELDLSGINMIQRRENFDEKSKRKMEELLEKSIRADKRVRTAEKETERRVKEDSRHPYDIDDRIEVKGEVYKNKDLPKKIIKAAIITILAVTAGDAFITWGHYLKDKELYEYYMMSIEKIAEKDLITVDKQEKFKEEYNPDMKEIVNKIKVAMDTDEVKNSVSDPKNIDDPSASSITDLEKAGAKYVAVEEYANYTTSEVTYNGGVLK